MTECKPTAKDAPFRPKKRLAQHFLRDQGVIRHILSHAGFAPTDHVLEVGPGLGALTIPLAPTVHRILAVEKDPRLVEMLAKRLRATGIDNVTLLHGDILRFDFGELASPREGKIQVIGNLPYNISSPLLEKLVHHREHLGRAVLMFQKEFAQRLLSSPGNKEYGAITVVSTYFSSISRVLEISKEAFFPRPKVGSMVLHFDFTRPYPRRAADERLFRLIVKGAFAHRRKTLINSLSSTLTQYRKEDLLKALQWCDIDPRRRAEALTIEDYLSLSGALASDSLQDKKNSTMDF